ncbi:integration host factor subunit alpha [Rhodoblastus acidophilus]|uniref:Integration host factor subunit alpha n=1 Tax=Candidatus Rhodoblastus alkanivorans TaxID=2954117 RepID=A0ABS9Z6A6_9HYPH|nr:integration host factor subunit alpha [Candidatus Rhodoblastus alkanivorans]MCI4679160.1 integration host factor subunit alpha [Candidatus Rhodoblastus alkanivorans]MCI4683156.1 integration host factor subunit alpha [Candidatus Rhodoblastus alkanivorans]MDI4640467.1 integration host factor subunit alpha [Rhodoblastus acidophilus]
MATQVLETKKITTPAPAAGVPVEERKQTVTRSDLADAVFRRIGLSRLESAQLVEMVIDEISDAVLRGENVKLSGFGTFIQRSKRERVGRNPKTGVEATISPRKVLVFKASHIMRDRINQD